jgi:hypothetical protein
MTADDRPTLRDPDLENLHGQDTGRETLSHTRLSVFLACHRKFELDYIRRLEPIRKARALTLGGAYQKGVEFQDPEAAVLALNGHELEKCRCGTPVGQAPLVPELGDCELCDGAGYTATAPDEPVRFYDQEDEDRHRVDEVIVRSASALYLRTYPSSRDEHREFPYRIQLRNPWTGAYSRTFDLEGYADGLAPVTQVGGLEGHHWDQATSWELTENKLVGQLTAIMVKRLPLDRQLALERYAIWRVTGLHVGTVRYRFLKKPSIKQRGGRKKDKSDAESLDEFLERLAGDYLERPEFYAPPEENPLWVPHEDLLRIEIELWEWAEDVRAKLRLAGGRQRIFDRNTAHCSEYGGCKFMPICTGDPDAMSLYRERPKRSTINESAPEAEK